MSYDAIDFKRRLITLMVLAVLAGLGWYFFFYEDRVVLPPGVHAPDHPTQSAFGPIALVANDDYTVTALAEFSLRGKVLSRCRYRRGPEADFSPVDFAIGWGRMSDQAVVDEYEISQGGRWASFRYSGSPPLPESEFGRSCANMHMVPKNDEVRSALLDIRAGEIIELEGYLVQIDTRDGWSWDSSLSRNDTGDGACEIVWVQDIRVVMSDDG